MVEAAGIEPEDESPVDSANRSKKRSKIPAIQEVASIDWGKKKQNAEEAAHLSGIDPKHYLCTMYATTQTSPIRAGLGGVV